MGVGPGYGRGTAPRGLGRGPSTSVLRILDAPLRDNDRNRPTAVNRQRQLSGRLASATKQAVPERVVVMDRVALSRNLDPWTTAWTRGRDDCSPRCSGSLRVEGGRAHSSRRELWPCLSRGETAEPHRVAYSSSERCAPAWKPPHMYGVNDRHQELQRRSGRGCGIMSVPVKGPASLPIAGLGLTSNGA